MNEVLLIVSMAAVAFMLVSQPDITARFDNTAPSQAEYTNQAGAVSR